MITVTETAARKIQTLMAKQGKEGQALRVFVQGGGCSGFRYGMTFDERERPGDLVVEAHGLRVFVDRKSLMYLDGSEIDYRDALQDNGYKINNPNAIGSCGCGHSFQLKPQVAAKPKPKLIQL